MAGRGLSDNEIDDESLKLWGAWCDANSLRCDLVIDSAATDAEIEQLIAQCGWASVSKATGKRGVIWENDNHPVTVVFNPANIVAGSMRIEYQNEGLADEVVGTFVDRDSEYGQNTIRRLVEGVVAPARTVTVPLRGITGGAQAAKELNRMAAAQHYHQRHITWEASAEGGPLFVTRGDVVGLGHDLAGGTVGSRLTDLDTGRVTLTTPIALPASGMAWIWGLDGSIHVTSFTRSTLDAMAMVVAVALPTTPGNISDDPSAYRFVAFADGVAPVKVRITGVEHSRSGYYKFTARDEIALYYNARSADLSYDLLPDRSQYRPVNTDTPPLDIDGQQWHFGEGAPATTLGSNGNYYLRITTNQIYLKRGGLWTVIANLSGADQAQWHVGTGVPPDTLGADTDLYFRVGTTGQIYQKAGGSWSILIELRGGTWLAGAGLPNSSLGNIGDLYYRTSNGFTYEKKTDTFWEFLRDLTGPGIDSVVRNDQTGIVTVTFRDGNTDTFTLADGEDGDDGASVTIDTTLRQPNGDLRIEFSDGTEITVPAGIEGKGIFSIIRNEETGIVTVTLDDGTTRFYTATAGRDGPGKEFIFIRTQEDERPDRPVEPNGADPPWNITDDIIPSGGWTDEQVGVDATNRFEWLCVRNGSVENWGPFKVPTRLSAYTEIPDRLLVDTRPEWVEGKQYLVGDVLYYPTQVIIDGVAYIVDVIYTCVVSHVASTTNAPGETATAASTGYLMVDSGSDDLWTFDDLTNPGEAESSALHSSIGNANCSVVYNNRFLIGDTDGKELWEIPNVLNPSSASLRGVFPSSMGSPDGMALHNGEIIVVDGANKLWRIPSNLDPSQATLISTITQSNFNASGLASTGTKLFVLDFDGRQWYEITNINTPTLVNRGTFPSGMNEPSGCVIIGGRAYIVSRDGLWRIIGLNPSNAAQATKLGSWPVGVSFPRSLVEFTLPATGYWTSGQLPSVGQTAPSVIEDFTLTPVSQYRIDITWDEPASGARPYTYRVECSQDSSFPVADTEVLTADAGQTGTFYYDATLLPNTLYYYRVRAMGPGGTGPWSATQSSSTLAATPNPTVPRNVSINAVGQSLTLSWAAPSTGSPFTKYEVESALNDTFTLGRYIVSEPGTATDSVFIGTGSTTYYLRVRAVNAQGNGPWSAVFSATTGAVGVPPTAVVDLAAAVASDTEINLSWDEPTDGDTPITYQVDRATDAAFSANLDTRANNRTQSNFPDTGLTASTRYYYRVRGENTTGNGPWRSVSAVTQAPPVTAPGVPVATLSFTVLRSVDVSWNAISGAVTYEIQVSTSNTFPVGTSTINVTGLTGTSRRVTALTSGTTYYVRMRSVNAGGNSAWSAVVSGSTVQISVPPVNLSGSVSDDDVNLAWTHPIFPPDLPTGVTWRIQRADNSTFTTGLTTLATAQAVGTRTYTDSDRPAGTYYYRVRGEVSGAGNGEWRSISVDVSLPDIIPTVPQNFTADPPGVTGISFTWDPPAMGRPASYTYTLEVATNSAFTENLQTHLVNHVTGLTGGTTYYARVRASNRAGTSPWSDTLSVTTDTFDLPSAPRNLSGNFSTGGIYILSWNVPANGDTPFTYECEYASDSGFTTGTGTLFTGRSQTLYSYFPIYTGPRFYRVKANNVAGDGPWSGTLAAPR